MDIAHSQQLDQAFNSVLHSAVRILAGKYLLSAAECLVAHDVARGLCRRAMAARRARSERTIQSQIRIVLRKTGVRNTSDLRVRIFGVALALTLGGAATDALAVQCEPAESSESRRRRVSGGVSQLRERGLA